MKIFLNLLNFITALASIIILYYALLKNPAIKIYCYKKTQTQILSAKLAVNFTANSEEDYYITSQIPSLYQNCLQEEKFKK